VATGTLSDDVCTDIIRTISDSILDKCRETFMRRTTIRTQRTAINLVADVGIKYFAGTGELAIATLLKTIVQHHDTPRISNACHAALLKLYGPNQLSAAIHIVAAAEDIARSSPESGHQLIDSIRSWDDKAREYMQRFHLPQDAWMSIAKQIAAKIDATTRIEDRRATRVPRNAHDRDAGFAVWRSEPDSIQRTHVLPDGTGTCLAFNHQDLLHMSWNCNGLRARWRSGELMTLITEHKPDTLHLGEIKTDLDSLVASEELRLLLAMHGYNHCVFYWCTQTKRSGKGSNVGNFGSASSRNSLLPTSFWALATRT
jgi:hypothetical protein